MARPYAQWERFWFEPASPENLGFCRMLFFGSIFLLYLTHDVVAWAEASPVFWKPIGLFRILHLQILSTPILTAMQIIWKAALGFSCLGLFTRLSTMTSFILGVYILGLPYNFGVTSHNDAILVFVFGIMALARCGDSWSLDQLIRRAQHNGSTPTVTPPPMNGEYTWPIRAVWLIMALIFFAAGVAKLRYSGLEWITSDNLRIVLIQSNYGLSSAPLTTWGLYVAQYGWLCQLLAAVTLIAEVSYPLALFSVDARRFLVPTMAGIQIGIRLLMGPAFWEFVICTLFWVRWDRVSVPVFTDARRMRSFAASTFTQDS